MPTHETMSGIATGAVAGSTTVLLGAQVDALAVGLIAAIFVTIWLEKIDNKIKAASAVLFAALLAGYGSPVAAEWVMASVPSVSHSTESLRMLLALLIGGGAPSLVPVAIQYISRKGGAL